MGIPIDLIERMQLAGLSREDIQLIIDNWAKPVPEVSAGAMATRRWRAKKDITCDHGDHTKKGLPHTPSKEILLPSSSVEETSEEVALVSVFPTRGDVDEALDGWQLIADMKGLRKMRNLQDQDRRKKMRHHLKELGSLDAWGDVLIKVRESPFLCGERGFECTIDWLLKPANLRKVMEGNYDKAAQEQANGGGNGQWGKAHIGSYRR